MMSKKERDAIQAARAEQLAYEQDEERHNRLANAKEKRARAEVEREEKMARDTELMEIRRRLLGKTCRLMRQFEKEKRLHDAKKQNRIEWRQYLKCDGLPDPRIVTELATFLHVWMERATYDEDELEQKCIEVLPMLEMLDDFISAKRYTEMQIRNFKEIRNELRAQLFHAAECASYSVLRNLDEKMEWSSIKLCTYQRAFRGLRLNMWVAVRMPTRQPRPKKDGTDETEPIELEFPGIKVTVTLPTTVDGSCLCVRAASSQIDQHSEASRSFRLPVGDLPNRDEDLFEFNEREHAEICKKKAEQDNIRKEFYSKVKERVKELENVIKNNIYGKIDKEKEELERLSLVEPPFMPDPREWAAQQNENAMKEYLKSCILKTRSGELNLRKFKVCGGVLHLNFLSTPPQPKRMELGIQITTLDLPKTLKHVDYEVLYRTPVPVPGITRTPEEIEIELRRIESEYEKLALVFIELPQQVLWNEPPVVVQWQAKRRFWTSEYVNDLKYNEEKQTLQFRTGALWPIGLGCLRYSNMPYQGWEVKPDPKSPGVLVIITGICVTCTWLVLDNSVRLVNIGNASTPALKEHFHKKYSVHKMVQLMRDAACDFFPDFDGHNHVDGSCPKEWAMERHLYHAMAFLSRAYNFQWSRWNVQQGYRKIVIQVREAVDKKRESKLKQYLVTVTPQETTVLKGNEHMQDWNEDPETGNEFYPDLFAMNLSYGSIDARRATSSINFKLVETVFEFLQEIKMCSFS